jgi:uncharacterized repeat protein (TIGR01451 family)
MKCILTLCCSLLLFLQTHAQGWDKTLTDSVRVRAVSPTSDGGSIILGSRTNTFKVTVVKVDALGQRQWSKDFLDISLPGSVTPPDKIKIQQDSDGNYWFGIFLGSGNPQETVISKIDKDGNRLLLRKLTLKNAEINVLNNQLVLIGVNVANNNMTTVLRLKPNGDTLNSGTVPSLRFSRSLYFVTTVKSNGLLLYHLSDSISRPETMIIGFDGTVLSKIVAPPAMSVFASSYPLPQIITATDGSYFVPDSGNVVKLNSVGEFIWRKSIALVNTSSSSPFFLNYLMTPTQDGGFVGIRNNEGLKYLEIKRFNGNGDLVASSFGFYANPFINPFMLRSAQGGILLVGNLTANGTLRLMKLGESGYFYQYFIKGNVYSDRDDNCRASSADIPYQRAIIIGKRTGFPDIFALTDSLGKYTMNVDAGNYNITIVKPNRYIDPCTPSVSKTISSGNPLDSVDFPLKTAFYCGLMQVDVTTPRLRRCFENYFTVSYCNSGTATAVGAYVNVTLDSLLEFVSAGKPVASRTGRTYRFNLGDVEMNACGTFDIVARVRCGDSTRLNQTLCVAAKIYPDTICVPDNSLWSGANLIVSGTCQGDSVLFQVLNAGRAAAPASTSQVVENLAPTSLNIGALAVNGVFSKKYPANGNTWRMIVNQVPNHPRSTQPTAFVEGCRRTAATPFATGFAASFANDDADISLDVDCQPIIGAYDPNDKVGYPLGTGDKRAINQNQDIEYRIRFQNTGTDTAFTVVIRDTIDIANLDIQSIEWGASSHRYTPEIYKENIVKFTFDNILLVDSFTNEPKSNGFVKFRIKQKKDVAFGTRIQNSAGIYFDFNDPVLTNKTLHTVSKDIVSAVIDKSATAYPMVKVYPNPASETMTFELTDTPLSISTFELYDMLGKQIVTQQFSGKTFEFQRQSLPVGVYLFKMTTDNKIVGTGKLMIKD